MQLRFATVFVVAVMFGGSALAQPPKKDKPAQAQAQPQKPMVADTVTTKDIEATLGFMPQWLKMIPSALLPSFWQTLKTFQLSDETRLDRKTKELIGLGVAAQIPCEYCVMFHTQVAKMLGASDEEIREAVGMAAVTREASTLLNGTMIDKAQFKKDLDRMVRQGNKQARR